MPSIQQRVADQKRLGLKASAALLTDAGFGAAPAGSLPLLPWQGMIPASDVAEGYAGSSGPRSPVFTPIFRPTPLAVVQPAAAAKVQTSAVGTKSGAAAALPAPSAPAANFAASAAGTPAGVTVTWTPPAQNGADASGKLLNNLLSFGVYRGPLGGGFGGASLLATVTSSTTPGAYSYTDPNGLTDKFEYYIVPKTAQGNASPTLAVNAVAAVSSTQVPPTGSGGSGTGQILAVAINAAGNGYQVGDNIDITGGLGLGGSVQVTQIDPGGLGHIFGISLNAGGSGYSVTSGAGTSGGSGAGFTVDISSVA